MAAYAVKILNDNLAGQFTPQYVPPASIAGCMSCHGSAFMNNVAAKMECMQCHGDPHNPNAIQQISPAPKDFKLSQNYPNPFNPATKIEFSLPKPAFVTLKIYNLLGEEVTTLIAEKRETGIHKFSWDASGLASGVYLYRLEAGEFIQSKKLILMR